MNVNNIAFTFNDETEQTFGFHDSPMVRSGAARDFFNCSQSVSNASCWLNYMEDYTDGLGLITNSPLVVTHGWDALSATNNQNNLRMKANSMKTIYHPWTYFVYWYVNNGAGPCS